jgi:hypothetical protein
MYSVQTKFEFQGRVRTILRDENPLPGSPSAVVGAINWKEKTFEVHGQKRKYDEIRRTAGSLFNKYLSCTDSIYSCHAVDDCLVPGCAAIRADARVSQDQALEVVCDAEGVRLFLYARRVEGSFVCICDFPAFNF